MAVFVWGMGKNGQLGTGRKENVETPVSIGVSSTKRKGTEDRKAKAAKDIGQGALSSRARKAVGIGAGGLYTCVLTEDGQVFSTGSGTHGRLGSGTQEDAEQLQLVQSLHKHRITRISCGIWHGAAVTEDGEVYIWGYNKAHGVLGVDYHPAGPYAPPTTLGGDLRVAGITCGNNYTLAWTADGNLFSWGCGRHGVLGHGSEEDQHQPKRVQGVARPVIHADAGFAHSAVVTDDGQVFMMGTGSYGALGSGQKKLKPALVPRQANIPGGVRVRAVSCSKGEHHGHTLAVTEDGRVYAWGDGYKGKLGLGDQESRFDPTLIPVEYFNNDIVEHVSAGGIHSAAVTKEGQVYTWGCGSDGRLGHPESKGHRYLFRSDTPRVVEELVGKGRALDVKASYYHTVAIVARNET